MDEELIVFEFPSGIQTREYKLFTDDLEDDALVFFHGTSMKNFDAISRGGFKSANALNGSGLTSVTYARQSNIALIHVCGNRIDDEDMVIFVVRFTSEDLKSVAQENTEIKVFRPEIQPSLIGYCVVPATYIFR